MRPGCHMPTGGEPAAAEFLEKAPDPKAGGVAAEAEAVEEPGQPAGRGIVAAGPVGIREEWPRCVNAGRAR